MNYFPGLLSEKKERDYANRMWAFLFFLLWFSLGKKILQVVKKNPKHTHTHTHTHAHTHTHTHTHTDTDTHTHIY